MDFKRKLIEKWPRCGDEAL
jgi:hypothetical protein